MRRTDIRGVRLVTMQINYYGKPHKQTNMAEEKETKKVGVGLPITFSEFAKEPVKGVMFLCLVAVGYLYVDLKLNYNNQIDKQGQKIEALENKIDALTMQLRRADSLQSASSSKLVLLEQLGKIK